MDAYHSSSGIVVETCDCQQGIKCDVCELEMKGSIMGALKEGWQEVDTRLWYCQTCAEKWPTEEDKSQEERP